MKLITSVGISLVASVAANEGNLQSTFAKVRTQLENEHGVETNPPTTQSPRAIAELTAEGYPYEYIKSYGCWCNFDNYKAGRKDPVDFIDAQCKALHDNYECVNRANPGCKAHADPYNDYLISSSVTQAAFLSSIGQDAKAAQLVDQFLTACETLNSGDDCKIGSCRAEAFFVYKVVLPLLDITEDNPNRHQNDFDKSVSCQTNGGGPSDRLMVCCDAAPYSKLFNENGAAHALNPNQCTNAVGDTIPY